MFKKRLKQFRDEIYLVLMVCVAWFLAVIIVFTLTGQW